MIVDRFLHVGFDELSKGEWQRLEKALTFATDNGDVVISYRKMMSRQQYLLPRGAWNLLPGHIRYVDNRTCPKMPVLDFMVKLDDISKDERFIGQKSAVRAMFDNEQGIIIRPPGTGKTQIALAFASAVQTRTLVLVHTKDIMEQWIEYIVHAIPELKGKVGTIRGERVKIGHITVGMVPSLYNHIETGKWWGKFGCVIADEAHHASAPTWESVLNAIPAKYRFGFTASPTRADGMHPTMRFIIGPIIHRQKFSSPVNLEVAPTRTEFQFRYRGSYDWSRLLNALVRDEQRNAQIAEIAVDNIRAGNSVLVLSRRIEHLELIEEEMKLLFDFDEGWTQGVKILTSKVKGRKKILDGFREGTVTCLLATQLADEALDVPRLNRVLLTHPGKHEGRIIQQIGRAIRMHPSKTDAVIYDFVDHRIGVLKRQWNERKRTYRVNKIDIRSKGRLQWR